VGYFPLLAQEKVTKEKGNPKPPIPVPLASSRSRRELRCAQLFPPSAAMLGGYGSQRQKTNRHIGLRLVGARERGGVNGIGGERSRRDDYLDLSSAMDSAG